MKADQEIPLLGVGIYSVRDASRITRVSDSRIRYWLNGRIRVYKGRRRVTPPVWPGELPHIDDVLALSFLDLIEVRVVDKFRKLSVSWKTIRAASKRARELFETTHPFSTHRFKTDGRTIFTTIYDETHDGSLIDIVKRQYAFPNILLPYLTNLDFDDDDRALRWWPMGKRRRVVIDPQRSFGQPIVSREGVPTTILASAVKAEGSVDAVADWYDVDPRSVRDAVKYQEQLAA